MIKTLYDPKVEERGKEIARQEGRIAMREAILDFLSSFSDYDEYKDDVAGKLDEIKDFSRLKKLIKALAKVSSVKEFMDQL